MITIVTSTMCPYCDMAKQLLDSLGYKYENIDYTWQFEKVVELSEKTWMRTIPQIFNWEIDKENLIGGYSELKALYDAWKLEETLNK